MTDSEREREKEERKVLLEKIEHHLNRLSAFFYIVQMSFPDVLFCRANINGHFDELSGNWKKILGWTNEELMGKPWIEFVHPDDVLATMKKSQEMNDRDVFNFVNRYKRKDGTYQRLEWAAMKWNGTGTSYCIVKVLD